MLKVVNKLHLGNTYCVSVEGDVLFLKNGLKLIDEKKNVFQIKTVAMSHYKNVENYKKYAELVLYGDVEKIGHSLFLYE